MKLPSRFSSVVLALSLLHGFHVAAGTVELMTTASRTAGVAPLAVHFDALNPASGVLQAPGVDFLDYDYQWDFGDPGAGHWTLTTGKPRNQASGFVAGHVYAEPGEYTVSLTVRTPQGDVARYQQTVQVTDPAGLATYYVAADGSDSNPGTSPAQPFASLAHAMTRSAPNTRILFRRGDTFTSVNGVTVGGSGPRIVGAYGSGPRPILQTTGTGGASSSVFRISAAGMHGWRFVSLDLRGNTASSDNAGFYGLGSAQPFSDLLFHDLDISGFRSTGLAALRNECDSDHLFVTSTRIRNIVNSWAAFVSSERMALLGNDMDKQTEAQSHTLRVKCTRRSVLAHNRLWSAHHTTLKLHREKTGGAAGPYHTEELVISDNHFHGSNWQVALGPQDGGSNESIRRILYERNLHTTAPQTGIMLAIWARDVLVRNNIFIAGANRHGQTAAVQLWRLGIEPAPLDNRIIHNTFFNASPHGLDAVLLGLAANTQAVTNTHVRNNLLARSGNGWLRTLHDFGAGVGTVSSHNLQDANARFENASASDFRLLADSPAIDAGVPLGVRHDYLGAERDNAPDVGAFEHAVGHGIFEDGFELRQAGHDSKSAGNLPPPDPATYRPYPCRFVDSYTWNRGDGLGPISGEIFWPSSSCRHSDGPPAGRPLLVFSRGNGTTRHEAYFPLMRHLAQNGIVVAFLTSQGDKADQRAPKLLSYARSLHQHWPWRARLNRLVAFAGHSQGGQAALIAAQLARSQWSDLDLRAVAALAPSDHLRRDYSRNLPPLLVTAAGMDADVFGMRADGVEQARSGPQATGVAIFDRAGCLNARCESSREPGGGGHGIEKTLIFGPSQSHDHAAGVVNVTIPPSGYPDRPIAMPAFAFLNAFLRHHLLGDRPFAGYLDGRWSSASAGQVPHLRTHVPAERLRVLDDFEHGLSDRNSLGGGLSGHFSARYNVDLRTFRSAPHATRALQVQWAHQDSHVQWDIPDRSIAAGRLRDVRGFGRLSLRIAQVYGSVWNADQSPTRLRFRLLTRNGWSAPVAAESVSYPHRFWCPPPPAVVLAPCVDAGGGDYTKSVMGDLRIPLQAFSGADLSDVRAVRIELAAGGRLRGELILDLLAFAP